MFHVISNCLFSQINSNNESSFDFMRLFTSGDSKMHSHYRYYRHYRQPRYWTVGGPCCEERRAAAVNVIWDYRSWLQEPIKNALQFTGNGDDR